MNLGPTMKSLEKHFLMSPLDLKSFQKDFLLCSVSNLHAIEGDGDKYTAVVLSFVVDLFFTYIHHLCPGILHSGFFKSQEPIQEHLLKAIT